MGVNKAALEALVRGLARRHGRDLAARQRGVGRSADHQGRQGDPHFAQLARIWKKVSPIPWDSSTTSRSGARHMFLLSPLPGNSPDR
jgi:enoyl-[acyl-carrier-protein] reductase (NADH)